MDRMESWGSNATWRAMPWAGIGLAALVAAAEAGAIIQEVMPTGQYSASALTGPGQLFAPTSPTTAFELGQKTTDPVQMYLSDVCTLPVNIAGLPGISVPCGLLDGLPNVCRLVARNFTHPYRGPAALDATAPMVDVPAEADDNAVAARSRV